MNTNVKIVVQFLNIFRKITDSNLRLCKCGKKGNIRKLISSSGFRLKGSGWYETDFKTKNEKSKKPTSSSNKS